MLQPGRAAPLHAAELRCCRLHNLPSCHTPESLSQDQQSCHDMLCTPLPFVMSAWPVGAAAPEILSCSAPCSAAASRCVDADGCCCSPSPSSPSKPAIIMSAAASACWQLPLLPCGCSGTGAITGTKRCAVSSTHAPPRHYQLEVTYTHHTLFDAAVLLCSTTTAHCAGPAVRAGVHAQRNRWPASWRATARGGAVNARRHMHPCVQMKLHTDTHTHRVSRGPTRGGGQRHQAGAAVRSPKP